MSKIFLSAFTLLVMFSYSLLSSTAVFALAHGEKIKAKVLGYNQSTQTIMINRGSADDIQPKEHIRFYKDNSFVTRGYALDIKLHTTIMIVYQVFNEIPLIDDAELVGQRLPHRFVPTRVRRYSENINMDELLAEFDAILAQKNIVIDNELTYEFKESELQDSETIPILDSGGELALNPGVTVDEATDPEDDVDHFSVEISASPVKFSRQDDAREISYGASLTSMDWGNKELAAYYNYTKLKSKPSNFGAAGTTTITSSAYDAGVNFDINNFTEKLSFFMLLSYQRERDGGIYPLRHRWTGGPAGIKYDFYESDKIPDLSISYIPLFEFQKSDVEEVNTVQIGTDLNLDPIFEDQFTVNQVSSRKWRHSFRFKFKWYPSEYFAIENTFWYKPAHDMSNKDLDLQDALMSNDFLFSYTTESNLSFSYQNIYTWDITLKRLNGLPSSNMDHIFTVGYNFTF